MSAVVTAAPPLLGRKQRSSHEDWLRSWEHIRARPDTARARELVETAAGHVRRRVRGLDRVAYGWSGGKDSQGLRVVMEAAGVTDAVLVISGLEYPAFLGWATDEMPWSLTIECRDGLDLRWLAAHPRMLFPTSAADASRWFAQLQHAGQRAYARRERLDLLVLGRRGADGNYLGDRPDDGRPPEYRDRDGFVRYSPIADWTHEDLLHVLAAYEVPLPPCYSWPRGFRVGTGAWPARQWTTSPAHGWAEVLAIDPTVVEHAARAGFTGAREALACAD